MGKKNNPMKRLSAEGKACVDDVCVYRFGTSRVLRIYAAGVLEVKVYENL